MLHDFVGGTTSVDNSLWTGSHVYRLEYQPSHEGAGARHKFPFRSSFVESVLGFSWSCFATSADTVVLVPGGTEAGYVLWTLDGKQLVKIDAHALRNRHGIGTDGKPFTVTYLPSLTKRTRLRLLTLGFVQQVHDRLISKEPMYLLFNIAISDYWKVQDPCATHLLSSCFSSFVPSFSSCFCLASFCTLVQVGVSVSPPLATSCTAIASILPILSILESR